MGGTVMIKTFILAVLIFLFFRGLAAAGLSEPVLLTEVNTEPAEEWAPFLSFDGMTLYFSRVRSDSFYYGRIFRATRQEPFGPFTSVREIPGDLNLSPGHDLCPWVSPDNLRMYYHYEYQGIFSLRFSERTSVDEPWPEGTEIVELNVLGEQLRAPKLTPDELNIFFDAYELPGGKGGYDIWMATRLDRNSPFGNVTNLSELNTTSHELGPSVSSGGFNLFFHSNRNGSYQIFQATRQSLTEPFIEILHLAALDTPEGASLHPYLVSDNSTIYFMRQFGEDRSTRDIWISYLTDYETYYVDVVKGSDSNNGLSPEKAFASIQMGISVAKNGDTILVYPGIYSEGINFLGKSIKVQGIAGSNGIPVIKNVGGFAASFNNDEGPESILKNVVVTNSVAAIFIVRGSPAIINVTIVNNMFGVMSYAGSEPDIRNSIFWNNTYGDMLECHASFSCYQGAFGSQGNIDADPLFVDVDNGNFHLRSKWGRYLQVQDKWILDDISSPCIDSGDPDTDCSREPIPNGGRVNMGAYGGTTYASLSEPQ
jgi:hypothetical protein